MKTVDIIASGYEWICPDCEHYNTEIGFAEFVKCTCCKRVYETNPPEHAYGK